jgi:hypothetical protein
MNAYYDNLFGGITPQPLHGAEIPAVVVTLTPEQWQDNRDFAAIDCPAACYINGYLPGYDVPELDTRGWSIYDAPQTGS